MGNRDKPRVPFPGFPTRIYLWAGDNALNNWWFCIGGDPAEGEPYILCDLADQPSPIYHTISDARRALAPLGYTMGPLNEWYRGASFQVHDLLDQDEVENPLDHATLGTSAYTFL